MWEAVWLQGDVFQTDTAHRDSSVSQTVMLHAVFPQVTMETGLLFLIIQLPSCPSSSMAPSGCGHAGPAHGVGLCEAGTWLFPWTVGMNMKLFHIIVIQG